MSPSASWKQRLVLSPPEPRNQKICLWPEHHKWILTGIKKHRQGHFLVGVNPAFASQPESGEGDGAPSPGKRLRRGSAKQSYICVREIPVDIFLFICTLCTTRSRSLYIVCRLTYSILTLSFSRTLDMHE